MSRLIIGSIRWGGGQCSLKSQTELALTDNRSVHLLIELERARTGELSTHRDWMWKTVFHTTHWHTRRATFMCVCAAKLSSVSLVHWAPRCASCATMHTTMRTYYCRGRKNGAVQPVIVHPEMQNQIGCSCSFWHLAVVHTLTNAQSPQCSARVCRRPMQERCFAAFEFDPHRSSVCMGWWVHFGISSTPAPPHLLLWPEPICTGWKKEAGFKGSRNSNDNINNNNNISSSGSKKVLA